MSDSSEKLPKRIDESTIIDKIKNIPNKLGDAYSWIRFEESKPFVNALASLGSFVVGDPTGLSIPLLLACGDNLVRKRAQKHIPELANIMILYKPQFNSQIIQSEFGQQLLRDIVNKIIQEDNEQKIHYLKSFLISIYSQPIENYDIFRKYKDMLFQMDPIRLQILTVMSDPKKLIPKILDAKIKQHEGKKSKEIGGLHIPEDYNNHHLKFNNLLFEQSISELRTQGILKNLSGNEVGLGGEQLSQNISPEGEISTEFHHSRKLAEQYEKKGLTFRDKTKLQIEINTVDFITDFGWHFIQFFKTNKELSDDKNN